MAESDRSKTKKHKNMLLRLLGPGLVTGAADDDPSGIATYSQAGAQFGYGLLWTVFLTTPFMIAIQLVSARIGRGTGKGLAAHVMELAPRWLVLALVFLLDGVPDNAIHDRHPAGECADRQGDRQGPCRQCDGAGAPLAGAGAGLSSGRCS